MTQRPAENVFGGRAPLAGVVPKGWAVTTAVAFAALGACRGPAPTSDPVDASVDASADGGSSSLVTTHWTPQDASTPEDAGADADASFQDAAKTVSDGEAGTSCSDACARGATRCVLGDGSTGAEVQSCEIQANGCSAWVATVTCGAHQTCALADAGAACVCDPTLCAEAGTVCQDAQTVVTCRKDSQGCFYVDDTATVVCASPKSCSGASPAAACSSTCTDSCSQGQTACVSGGAAACELGANGCWAYGQPKACPSHETCTGSAGSAQCTCSPDPLCGTVATACSDNSHYVTCEKDSNGCSYESPTQACSGGTTCQNGSCSCPSGTRACNGTCTNTNTDDNNCGACANVCSTTITGATSHCDGTGKCAPACNTSGESVCGTACVSLQTSPQNCGACGHGCAGTSCTGGLCQAYPVTTADGVTAMASDGVNLYWMDTPNGYSFTLRQVDVAGQTAPITISTPIHPGQIAVAGGVIAYTAGFDTMGPGPEALWYASVGRADSAVQQSFETFYNVNNGYVAQGMGDFYVSLNSTNGVDTSWAAVDRCSVSGSCTALYQDNYAVPAGPATPLATWVAYAGGPYWIEAGASIKSPSGVFWSGNPNDLTSDGTYLYWVSGSSILRSISGATASPSVVTTSLASMPDTLASDGNYVYYGASGPSGVGLYAAAAGVQKLIVPSVGSAVPTNVVVANGFVYWTETTGSQSAIRRVVVLPN